MKSRPAQKLLFAFYADDFTGSTDALESLATAGLRPVLFLRAPDKKQLAMFPGLRAFGIAGGSRAMPPPEMKRELSAAFRSLKASGAPVIHYKCCSTFDSSPDIGSIGRAIELGRDVFGQRVTPLVVGSPSLGRYVVFGNMFAQSGEDSEPMRLDRHPMSRHPVTPMDEADLRRHLARQTRLPIGLLDELKLKGPLENARRFLAAAARKKPAPIILFDTFDRADLAAIGRLLWEQRRPGGRMFCAGSSSIGYAFAAHWREIGLLPALRCQENGVSRSEPVLAISGSCSPVTDRQIGQARQAGFVEVSCNTALLADARRAPQGVEQALALARPALASGRHIIFHTARGTADPRRAGFEQIAKNGSVAGRAAASARLGNGLARILQLALAAGPRRVVICGGDTAMQAARTLRIEALEFVAAGVAGAPVCRIHAPNSVAHGCEVICKGGQVGPDSFFLDVAGRAPKKPLVDSVNFNS